MKRKLLSTATAAALCIGSGGAFADQPVDKEGPEFKSQWDLQQYITVCSNNGRGNNHETVSSETVATGAPPLPPGCLKFVNSNDLEFTPNNNQNGEPECPDGRDCDPKPSD